VAAATKASLSRCQTSSDTGRRNKSSTDDRGIGRIRASHFALSVQLSLILTAVSHTDRSIIILWRTIQTYRKGDSRNSLSPIGISPTYSGTWSNTTMPVANAPGKVNLRSQDARTLLASTVGEVASRAVMAGGGAARSTANITLGALQFLWKNPAQAGVS
jgi:hypothetical protein